MKRSRGRLTLCGWLIGAILLFIWGNSLLPAEISQALSDWAKSMLVCGAPGESSGGSGLLRKIAHFTEFAALGMSLGWLFGMLGKKKRYPMLWGFGAACVDECIQLFVPGRGPGIFDVALDTAGVAVGIVALYIGYTFIQKRKPLFFGGKQI